MIGKTNSKQGTPAAQETVNIRLMSNQSEHSDLVGTKFTLSYGTFKKEYTWSGNEVTMYIPAYVTYSVEFGDAEGYNVPEPIIYEAVEDNARTIEAIYTCELLTVNVGADEGTPEGYEVAIYKGDKINLPSGYAFLEYIESTGAQYIDTGFKPNQDTRVVIDCELSTQDSYPKAIFGGRNNNTSVVNSFTFWAISNSGFRSEYGSAYKTISITPIGRFVIDKNKVTTTINGTATTNTSATFQSDYNLAIFSLMRPSGVDSRAASMKVYSCQIYDNGILIRDYVPAKNSSGVAGLYDMANDVFYKSASTTDFIAGSEIANPFTWLDYIESDGNQYIDTGFKPNNNTRVLLDLETLSNPSSTASFFGARTSADSKNYSMLYASSSGKLRSDYNNSYTQEFAFHTGRFIIDKDKEITIINGLALVYTNTSFQCDYNLFIFANNNAGSNTWMSSYRLYSCKIYDNGTLVLDYIPASRYDGSVGLYDKVNSKFYSSVSGTNFIAGDEVNLAGETIAVQTITTGSYKIPFGTEYSISANDISGFETPAIITRNASEASFVANIEYKKIRARDLSLFDVYGNPINRSTANCYVVSKADTYKIPLVFGNALKNGATNSAAYTKNSGGYSHDFVDFNGTKVTSPYIETVSGAASSAQLSIADTDGIFTDISIVDGLPCRYLQFKVNSVPATGANGVLSIKNSSGVIMWSWHIWVWAGSLATVEITNKTSVKYKILPVNLASKWDDTAKTKIKNWHYQFGRPNPMLCPSAYNSTSNHASYGALSYAAASIASNIQTGIKNPVTFYIYSSSYNYNWFQTNSGKTYNLWDAACTSTGNSDNDVVKTIYDPCPIGFKIPNGNTFTGLSVISEVNGIVKFTRYSGDSTGVGFPMSGCRDLVGSSFYDVGSQGYVWLSSAYSQDSSYSLGFDSGGANPQYDGYRAFGFSVRPVQE